MGWTYTVNLPTKPNCFFSKPNVFHSTGEQHPAEPQGEGDVEHHHQGFVAPGSYSGGRRLLPLPLHLDNPQRHEAGHQAVGLVSG